MLYMTRVMSMSGADTAGRGRGPARGVQGNNTRGKQLQVHLVGAVACPAMTGRDASAADRAGAPPVEGLPPGASASSGQQGRRSGRAVVSCGPALSGRAGSDSEGTSQI